MTIEELFQDEQWQTDEQTGKKLLPCPFCGAKLSDMPLYFEV